MDENMRILNGICKKVVTLPGEFRSFKEFIIGKHNVMTCLDVDIVNTLEMPGKRERYLVKDFRIFDHFFFLL